MEMVVSYLSQCLTGELGFSRLLESWMLGPQPTHKLDSGARSIKLNRLRSGEIPHPLYLQGCWSAANREPMCLEDYIIPPL